MNFPHFMGGLPINSKLRASPYFTCGYRSVSTVRLTQVLVESIKDMLFAHTQKKSQLISFCHLNLTDVQKALKTPGERIHANKTVGKTLAP